MQRWTASLAWALAVPLLAGCLSTGDPGPTDENLAFDALWSERAVAFGDDHDHTDRKAHRNLSTPNFEVLGHDPLLSPYYDGRTAGGYLCGDAAEVEDGRRLAAVESRTNVGFAIADVTNATAPKWLGELILPSTYVYDLAVAPDGKHVVLATAHIRPEGLPVQVPDPPRVMPGSPTGAAHASGEAVDARIRTGDGGTWAPQDDDARGSAPPGMILWRSPCLAEPVAVTGTLEPEEDPLPRPASLLLVSIEDPLAPRIVEHQPLLGNGHSVYITTIDDRTLMLVTTTRLWPYPFNLPVNSITAYTTTPVSFYEFYEIADGAGGKTMRLLSVYKPPIDEPTANVELALGPRGHDGWISVHPPTGKTVAYLAGGDRFTILDLSDPRMPREMGRWSDTVPGREAPHGQLHSVYPLPELWDGRHYTLLGPEFGGNPGGAPSGVLWVLDTTDPANVKEVAAWTLPHPVQWTGTYMFSNHYFTAYGTTAFISMYHGGVWALDLSGVRADNFTQLPSIGVLMPDRDPPEPSAQAIRWAPTCEEVLVFDDGTLVTFDSNSGLYTFRFDAESPAPAPEPWTIPAL